MIHRAFRVTSPTVFLVLWELPATLHADADVDVTVDWAVRTAIQALLQQDVATFDAPIEVFAKDAVVRLTGVVPDFAARNRAVAIAQRIRGVRAVVDELELRPAIRSDDQIATDVSRALKSVLASGADALTVSVNDGVAELRGRVKTLRALHAATVRPSKPVRQACRTSLQ